MFASSWMENEAYFVAWDRLKTKASHLYIADPQISKFWFYLVEDISGVLWNLYQAPGKTCSLEMVNQI